MITVCNKMSRCTKLSEIVEPEEPRRRDQFFFLSVSTFVKLMKPSKATFSKAYFMRERERDSGNVEIHKNLYNIKSFIMTFSIENDFTCFYPEFLKWI